MITAGDFRNGVTFEMDGNVVSIIEFQHVKPGKGAAFVRTKIRNVITGAVTERTFNPTEKFPTAFIERKDMEYLYNDGDLYYFMDSETYEQLPISPSILGDNFIEPPEMPPQTATQAAPQEPSSAPPEQEPQQPQKQPPQEPSHD